MANEPVNSGEKIEVAGKEGVVVRSVAVRGGVEYTVRVADEDGTVKLPPGYNPVAAYGTAEQAEVHEKNRKRDEKERAELEKALRAESDKLSKEDGPREEKPRDEVRPAPAPSGVSASKTADPKAAPEGKRSR